MAVGLWFFFFCPPPFYSPWKCNAAHLMSLAPAFLPSHSGPLNVYTWVKPVFAGRECQEGEAKSFCSQVWWKIAIVWVLPSPDIGHSDAQKCHSSHTSDVLEHFSLHTADVCWEWKTIHAAAKKKKLRREKKQSLYPPSFIKAKLHFKSVSIWKYLSIW